MQSIEVLIVWTQFIQSAVLLLFEFFYSINLKFVSGDYQCDASLLCGQERGVPLTNLRASNLKYFYTGPVMVVGLATLVLVLAHEVWPDLEVCDNSTFPINASGLQLMGLKQYKEYVLKWSTAVQTLRCNRAGLGAGVLLLTLLAFFNLA